MGVCVCVCMNELLSFGVWINLIYFVFIRVSASI